MKGLIKIIYMCLILALLCENSAGFFSRRRRKCPKGIFRIFARRRCRKPTIKMVLTTPKPKTLPPVKATTTQPPAVVFKPVVQWHSSGLPYCKERDLSSVLRSTRRRTKRMISWPYECQHASIVKLSGDFEFVWPIFDCCSKCNFPAFTTCAAKKGSPDWLCPSQGLHCIVDCVNKHDPGRPKVTETITTSSLLVPVQPDKTSILVKPGKPGKPGKPVKPVLNRCEKLDKTENGEECVRKLCVPLNFKP